MRLASLIRTSAFRITVLYTGLFSTSVTFLLTFIYGATVAVIEQQTTDTIEAEIRGLAEQYSELGLGRLILVIHERVKDNDDNVYLLTDPLKRPLAGNLSNWPDTPDGREWVQIALRKREEGRLVPHDVLARTFLLADGHRLLVGRDTYEKNKFRAIVVRALGWSLVATIALGLVGGFAISQRMLRRVQRVATTARRIAGGDLSRRLETSGSGDEFDRLADSLNAMLGRIERLMTGTRLATDAMAHDLRSPLTRLKSRIELALHHPPDRSQDREALADILVQTDLALSVFDNLLNIAVAEARHQSADLGPGLGGAGTRRRRIV
ncbi:MAG: HAMP domain-containing histidine kinase [Rhodospirillales bacterium]|nr:HAMP domain-containing histidine kinase [Rhodospirillales bacterium]